MELEKKFEDLAKVVTDFKTANDERFKQLEKNGKVDPLLEEKVNKANEAITKTQEEIKAMQTAMNRAPQQATGKDAKLSPEQLEHKKAFLGFLRKGQTGNLTELEKKIMSVDSDPNGGFLVDEATSSTIIEKVYESSPIRSVANVETISTDALEIFQDLDEAESGWVSEQQARPATANPVLKMIRIPVHELYAQPKATQKILDDAAWNLEAWLARKVSAKFSRDEATAFVSGNGVGKPRGFLDYAAGTGFGQIEQVNSGDANLVTSNGLIDLFYSLKEPYQANATWAMRRVTVAAIRKLKDLQGQYMWQPGLQAGNPDLLLGRPLLQCADMPAVAASALPIAVGDFKQGYTIVDRMGIRVLRDNLTAKPAILFYTTKRVGGDVSNFEAIKLQKISA